MYSPSGEDLTVYPTKSQIEFNNKLDVISANIKKFNEEEKAFKGVYGNIKEKLNELDEALIFMLEDLKIVESIDQDNVEIDLEKCFREADEETQTLLNSLGLKSKVYKIIGNKHTLRFMLGQVFIRHYLITTITVNSEDHLNENSTEVASYTGDKVFKENLVISDLGALQIGVGSKAKIAVTNSLFTFLDKVKEEYDF